MNKLIKVVGVVAVVGGAVGLAFLGTDSKAAQLRETLLLAKEPAGSVTIEDARANIKSKQDVVLTVRIGARDVPQVWLNDTASFYVSEATPGSHYNADADHDPLTCPFCSRNWKPEDSMALVHLKDKSGSRISMNGGELLGVEKNEVIVVKGTASLDDNGLLVVETSDVFLRD